MVKPDLRIRGINQGSINHSPKQLLFAADDKSGKSGASSIALHFLSDFVKFAHDGQRIWVNHPVTKRK